MNDKKDSEGNFLSDAERLTRIGRFVRKKKGFPWLATYKPIITTINSGLSTNKPKKAAKKSNRRLKNDLYIYFFLN
jgi:hypothetical protein